MAQETSKDFIKGLDGRASENLFPRLLPNSGSSLIRARIMKTLSVLDMEVSTLVDLNAAKRSIKEDNSILGYSKL